MDGSYVSGPVLGIGDMEMSKLPWPSLIIFELGLEE